MRLGTVVGYRGMRPLGLGDAYDARYRIYDAELRLFWSKDPLGWVDGYDRWAYVCGDPVNLWDPWGLAAAEDRANAPYQVLDPNTSEAQWRQRAQRLLTRDMGRHAIATVGAAGGEVRDRLEKPSPLSPQWHLEIAMQSAGTMQSLAHRVDEVGIAATAGNLVGDMAIAMTPMLPEAMAVVSSGGEDSGAIVGLMFAVLETVAMGAARQPGGAAGAAGGSTALRQQYVESVQSLSATAAAMRQAGISAEQIARALVAERNALKVRFRELSPTDAVRRFEQRNIQRYGDPLGPSVEQLRAAGKTWDQIIESATRPGGHDFGF